MFYLPFNVVILSPLDYKILKNTTLYNVKHGTMSNATTLIWNVCILITLIIKIWDVLSIISLDDVN